MLFNEFGRKENPPILLLHGMMQDWHYEYELLKPLEQNYHLIIPAQDGFYDGSDDFTSFSDQARQIEEYIDTNYAGKIHGAYGASQGGLMLTELLTRNKIDFGTVIMDGCYVAHQGKVSGIVTAWMFKKYKNTGQFPVFINVMMKLMGTSLEEMSEGLTKGLYMKASDETINRNFIENYTYRTRPEIAHCNAKVYLFFWQGIEKRKPCKIAILRNSDYLIWEYNNKTVFCGISHNQSPRFRECFTPSLIYGVKSNLFFLIFKEFTICSNLLFVLKNNNCAKTNVC